VRALNKEEKKELGGLRRCWGESAVVQEKRPRGWKRRREILFEFTAESE